MTTFICYSNKDSDIALQLRQSLSSHNMDVWLDQFSIPPGNNWQESIEAAINSCSHMIVLLSRHAVKSKEVEAEWSLALSLGKIIIPVNLDGCTTPYRLKSIHGLSFPTMGIAGVVKQLKKILPKKALSKLVLYKHILAKDRIQRVPKGYACFNLDLGLEKGKTILMRVNAYSALREMLDDLFMYYLADLVTPYSYGSEWVLVGEPFWTLIAVPLEWIKTPGQPIAAIAPEWADSISPVDLTIRPGSRWRIIRKKGSTVYVFNGIVNRPYAIASNDDKVVSLLLSEAKAISAIYRNEILIRKQISEIEPQDFSNQFVFYDWPGIGLEDSVLVDSKKEFPTALEKLFSRRFRHRKNI